LILTSSISAVVFGLAAALSWGVGDFTGGTLSKRIHVMVVAVVINGMGLLMGIGLALWRAEPFPPLAHIGWGMLAGVIGVFALISLYRALAEGQMGIAAPLTSVLGAGLPVLYGMITEGLPHQTQLIGFGLAAVGILLVSYSGSMLIKATFVPAMLAGLGFALFYITLEQGLSVSLFWTLSAAKFSSMIAIGLAAWFSRVDWQPARQSVGLLGLVGVLDMGGNVFYVLATAAGRMDVAVVLVSLYPGVTTLLAALIHKERLAWHQSAGVLAMLMALPLIAL
jgi:drug/metabolite transporter (DMT)-like permease